MYCFSFDAAILVNKDVYIYQNTSVHAIEYYAFFYQLHGATFLLKAEAQRRQMCSKQLQCCTKLIKGNIS